MMEKILDVPYVTQPTSTTCQSTCLKMYGLYLTGRLRSSIVEAMDISQIWKEINEGSDRPSKNRNSYVNMAWWLEKYFPPYKFPIFNTRDTDQAMRHIVEKIDSGFPVIVSTNHSGTSGHIILVCGYRGAEKYQSTNIKFVCHDPYGKFNPQLGSKLFGSRRYQGGSSLMSGGESGPGKKVVYDYSGIRRIRADKHSNGTYFLIAGDD
jgi:hypothetical protein